MTDRAKLIHEVHRTAHREWTRSARSLGLSFSEFEYLTAIDEQAALLRYEDRHGQHLQDIVDALGVTRASASAMVSKLEERGVVKRFQCRLDARAQHIVLTEKGQGLLKGGLTLYEKIEHAVAAALERLGN